MKFLNCRTPLITSFIRFQNKTFFNFFKKPDVSNKQVNESENSSNSEKSGADQNNSAESNSTSSNKESILSLNEANKYVESKVKKYDYYSYVIGHTLPSSLKPHYFAYHCFFSEILKSRFVSREQSVCKMRLNFWEENLIDVIKGKKPRDPLSVTLKHALENSSLRKDTLLRMIDFQYFDIERNSEIKTIQDLEVYAENTRSLILYLNLNLLKIDDKDAYYTASHIGRGVGIVDVLKQLPMLIKMHYNFIPLEVMERNACEYINLWDRHGVVSEEFYDCILEVASYAKKHIEIGRSYNDKLPKFANVALLNAIDSYWWLEELERANFDVFDPALRKISSYKIPKMILTNGKKEQIIKLNSKINKN